MKNTFEEARREQTSLVAPIERRILAFLVPRLPRRINADHLTLLGLFSLAAAGVFYSLSGYSHWWLHMVNLALFLNWFGDSLDGNLARYRRQLRPRYGFYVDHVVDTSGTLLLVGGLVLSPYMTGWVGLCVLIAYYMLSINSYLATHVLGTFTLSFWKFSPTEMRLILAIGNLALLLRPMVKIAGNQFLLFDVGGVIAAALILVVFVVSAIVNTVRLYNLEPRVRSGAA
jgi:archaetidylinositol phosphate synthase